LQHFWFSLHSDETINFIISAVQVEDISEDALTARNGVKFAKEVQRLQGLGDDEEAKDKKNEDENHRFTVMDLERNSKKEKQDGSLAMAFEKRYMSMDLNAQGTHFFITLVCVCGI
jgi:hypothetical protein